MKKAQISGFMTWFFAFIIIFMIMLIFVLLAGAAKVKDTSEKNIRIIGGVSSQLDTDITSNINLIYFFKTVSEVEIKQPDGSKVIRKDSIYNILLQAANANDVSEANKILYNRDNVRFFISVLKSWPDVKAWSFVFYKLQRDEVVPEKMVWRMWTNLGGNPWCENVNSQGCAIISFNLREDVKVTFYSKLSYIDTLYMPLDKQLEYFKNLKT